MLLRRTVPSCSHHSCLSPLFTSFSDWILPCFCRKRKDREVGKHCYLWGSRRGQECSWFMPVKVTYSALPSHTFSLLSVHGYLAYIAFKCEICCDSVALIKLFPLSACLYPSCLSLLWNTNHEKSLGGVKWNWLSAKLSLMFSGRDGDCTNRTK